MKKNRNIENVKYLFEPRSVAVIGASQKKGKIGYIIIENMQTSGYAGKIFPVNPKGGETLGLKMYCNVKEIPDDIDMAVITIPDKFVFDAVKDCAEKKVKNLVIITSGFSEVGNSAEEKKIVDFAKEHGMSVLGPNIFGVYSAKVNMNATFGPADIKKGNVSIITQSGAIGIAMIGKTKTENIGLSSIISVGNKSDIDEADLLSYLIEDQTTKIILMYMEGVRGGHEFVELLSQATKKKPVVVIKSGRSKRGAMAAASHTGSLAGADGVFDEIVRQCGVLRAESIQEALDWCKFIAYTEVPKGENTVIITNGGGVGVLAADACEKYNVNLYDDVDTLKKNFSSIMPTFGSFKNPVDLTGTATASDYAKALDVALESKSIDSVICLGCETAVFNATNFAKIVQERYKKYQGKKPVVFSVFGGEEIEECVVGLRKENVPIFPDVYDAVSCLGSLYTYYRNMKLTREDSPKIKINAAKINKITAEVKKSNRCFLLAHEAKEVMEAAGITMPKSRVVKTLNDAVDFAEDIGYPVVLKIVSKDIIHKSDAGGVVLDLENRQEVLDAYESIIHNCKKYKSDAVIDGIEVAPMVKQGVETIVGAKQDSSFGAVVMFGLGGIYVEVMKDVVFRAFPFGKSEAYKMMSDIRSYPLLLGVRGEEQKDIDCVADVILKVGTILNECEDISDIEINPVVVYEKGEGVRAVDARILLD